jgi:uncharacterized membrane protein (Fun14 family)
MSIVNDLIGALGGTIGGLPTIVVLVAPFVVGLVVGFLIKKLLKIGIILGLVTLVAVYFGFVSLDTISTTLSDLVDKYGPVAMSYVAVFFGIVPLGLGLIIGIALGFIFG